MNKNGQTLVIFVILIPLFLILAAFIIDNSLIVSNSLKTKSVTRSIITNCLKKSNCDQEKIVDLYKKNDIPIDDVDVFITDDEISITNNYYVDSIFAKIIGIKNFEIKVNIKGVLKDNKIIFE